MYFEVDGQRVDCAPDPGAVLQILKEAAGHSESFVSVHRDSGEFLQAALGTDQTTALLKATATGQQVVVPDPPMALAQIAAMFAGYANGTAEWEQAVSWDQSDVERVVAEAKARGRVFGRKLLKFTVALVLVILATAVATGKLPPLGALSLLFGLSAFGAYLWWLNHLFMHLVPRVAQRLTRRLGVQVVERSTASSWTRDWPLDVEGDAPFFSSSRACDSRGS